MKCEVLMEVDPEFAGCERDGWPQLDGMCPDHWREYRLMPLRYYADQAEAVYEEASRKLYLVEIAQGLRPAPYSTQYTSPPIIREANPRPRGARELRNDVLNAVDDLEDI